MMTSVGSNVDPAAVGGKAWQDLVTVNTTIAPCTFSYDARLKQLLLYRAERNVDITAANVRLWTDQLVDVAIATQPQWRPFNAAVPKTPAAQ